MSGWIEHEVRGVKLIHHSTSSTIEMLITTNEEVKEGKFEKVTERFCFDYGTFSDLRKVVNQTDFP